MRVKAVMSLCFADVTAEMHTLYCVHVCYDCDISLCFADVTARMHTSAPRRRVGGRGTRKMLLLRFPSGAVTPYRDAMSLAGAADTNSKPANPGKGSLPVRLLWLLTIAIVG